MLATAQFSLRSAFDLGAIVPVADASLFGHDYLQLELVLALFGVAAAIALAVDRPERPARSVAELLATGSALAAGAATLVMPGLAGHAGQLSPRGLALPLDAVHLAAGAIWLGGLIGIVVFWLNVGREGRVAALSVVVPRFSTTAFVSVLALIGTGIGQSLLELPTLASLWETNYGKALVVKIVLLFAALALAAVNLARTKPRLEAAGVRPSDGPAAALLLRRLVQGEILFVAGAVFAAAVLTSLPPPASALARVKDIAARVGPGPVSTVDRQGPVQDPRPGDAEPGGGQQLVPDHGHQGRTAGSGRRGRHAVQHARHGDGHAELPLPPDATRLVLEVGARARDGRPLGAAVRGDDPRPAAVRDHAPGQGGRMSVRVRLLLALVAVAAAAVAWVVAIEAIRRVI